MGKLLSTLKGAALGVAGLALLLAAAVVLALIARGFDAALWSGAGPLAYAAALGGLAGAFFLRDL